MQFNRRNVLSTALFGAGYLGLRSLATGIPTAILAKGKSAFADEMPQCAKTKAQFMILATSGQGDPLNANAPGTYGAGRARLDRAQPRSFDGAHVGHAR